MYTNQINGRHSFLRGKLLKKCVSEQNCSFDEDFCFSASLAFFKICYVILFLEVCLILRPWYGEFWFDGTMFIILTIWIPVSFYRDDDTSWYQTLDSYVIEQIHSDKCCVVAFAFLVWFPSRSSFWRCSDWSDYLEKLDWLLNLSGLSFLRKTNKQKKIQVWIIPS